jgi:hypothetical protein
VAPEADESGVDAAKSGTTDSPPGLGQSAANDVSEAGVNEEAEVNTDANEREVRS